MAGNVKNTLILDPLRVIQSLDNDQFEQMIEDWQTYYKGTKYQRVERTGGTGDKGRDVRCTGIGLFKDRYIFQAKNYNKKLNKSDIFPDIAKCCYNCFKNVYDVPKEYKFLSPLGVTPTVSDLFADSFKLKEELKTNWTNMCESKLEESHRIPLEGDLLTYFDNFDFSIFNYVSPQEFIEDFKKTCYYTKYFLQLNKPRPLTQMPELIADKELKYIGKILEAYDEYLEQHVENVTKLKETNPKLWADFNRHRYCFYSAEFLSAYSREIFAPETQWFEGVKEEVYYGIIQDIEEDAKNGFERLNKVMKRVGELNISANNQQISIAVTIQDRRGICHHLANDRDEVTWKK
jgi:hypothetical protein